MDSRSVVAIALDWRMRRLLRVNLEATGLQVREAVSGRHSLELIRDARPDLVLVDLDDVNVEAEELIRTIREPLAGRPVPIIVLSAELSDGHLIRPDLATSHLRKPFSARTLLERVAQALELEHT